MSFTLARTPLRILVTGATGFIGGSVLDRLLADPDRASFEIVSFSRDAEKAQKLEAQFGVKTVLGSLDDVQKIEDAAVEADLVINMANVDHLPAAQAILRGLKRRYEATGKASALIHTSGTGELVDNSAGTYSEHIKYDDSDVDSIKSVPKDAMHRNVDLAVVDADLEGYVRTYIVSPGIIYGLASGPVLSAGLAKRQSFPVSWVIKAGAANGSVGTFADGSSVWPYVHIDDIAGLFIVLLDALRTSPERAGHGWEGFYFGATASPRAGDIARYISDALAKVGQIQPAQGPLKPWTKEEIDKLFGGVTMLGTNCHAVATRARALGWKPKYSAEDIPDGILVEVEHMYGKQ